MIDWNSLLTSKTCYLDIERYFILVQIDYQIMIPVIITLLFSIGVKDIQV